MSGFDRTRTLAADVAKKTILSLVFTGLIVLSIVQLFIRGQAGGDRPNTLGYSKINADTENQSGSQKFEEELDRTLEASAESFSSAIITFCEQAVKVYADVYPPSVVVGLWLMWTYTTASKIAFPSPNLDLFGFAGMFGLFVSLLIGGFIFPLIIPVPITLGISEDFRTLRNDAVRTPNKRDLANYGKLYIRFYHPFVIAMVLWSFIVFCNFVGDRCRRPIYPNCTPVVSHCGQYTLQY